MLTGIDPTSSRSSRWPLTGASNAEATPPSARPPLWQKTSLDQLNKPPLLRQSTVCCRIHVDMLFYESWDNYQFQGFNTISYRHGSKLLIFSCCLRSWGFNLPQSGIQESLWSCCSVHQLQSFSFAIISLQSYEHSMYLLVPVVAVRSEVEAGGRERGWRWDLQGWISLFETTTHQLHNPMTPKCWSRDLHIRLVRCAPLTVSSLLTLVVGLVMRSRRRHPARSLSYCWTFEITPPTQRYTEYFIRQNSDVYGLT